MSDDQGGSSGSGSAPSPGLVSPSSASLPSSSSSPSDLHAQAVRFLTSIRHHSPSASTSSQREFLKSKGLNDEAIESALRDAERPENLTANSDDLSSPSTFDQAARAFDDPINNALPVIPAKNYPKSPLALYYDEADEQMAKLRESNRRYQVLLQFFKTFSWLLTLGGSISSILMIVYRIYVLPKITSTLDSRSYLLKHHHSLWDQVVDKVKSLASSSLAPSDLKKQIQDSSNATNASRPSNLRRTSITKKVQFADEVNGGKLEQREGEDENKKNVASADKEKAAVIPGTDVVVSAKDDEQITPEKEQEEEKKDDASVAQLPPIDLTSSIRSSLTALSSTLRGASPTPTSTTTSGKPSSAAASKKTPSVSDANGSDSDSSSSSDSWQDTSGDDDDDDAEFDPFDSAPKRTTKKKPLKKASSSQQQQQQSPLPSSINASSASSSQLYSSLTSLSSSITSRHLHNETRIGSSSNKYGSFAFSSSSASKSSSYGDESDQTVELAAQIRAEIRSLKGLLLSRRNFPRHGVNVGNTR